MPFAPEDVAGLVDHENIVGAITGVGHDGIGVNGVGQRIGEGELSVTQAEDHTKIASRPVEGVQIAGEGQIAAAVAGEIARYEQRQGEILRNIRRRDMERAVAVV